MFFLIWKMTNISLFKGPPLWFCAGNQKIRISGAKPKGGSEILAIFQIRKNMKNPEISEIAISPQSHNPTIPQSPSFFPRRPSRESERRPPDPKWSTVMRSSFSVFFSREEVRHHRRPFSYFSVHLSFEKVRLPSRPFSFMFSPLVVWKSAPAKRPFLQKKCNILQILQIVLNFHEKFNCWFFKTFFC